jgi:hypothetical protein
MMKRTFSLILVSLVALWATDGRTCTVISAGKSATVDGSVITSHT